MPCSGEAFESAREPGYGPRRARHPPAGWSGLPQTLSASILGSADCGGAEHLICTLTGPSECDDAATQADQARPWLRG